MDLIRDIRDYPWHRIVATICIVLPLVPTVLGPPELHGPRANAYMAIWLDSTIKFAALSLFVYRSFVANRAGHSFESAVLLIVLLASMYFGSSSLEIGSDNDPSVLALLRTDRGLLWSGLLVVVALVFIAARHLGRRPSRG